MKVVVLHLARDVTLKHPWSSYARAIGASAFHRERRRYGPTFYLGTKYRALVLYDKRAELAAAGRKVSDLPPLVRGELQLGNARAVREVTGVTSAAELLDASPKLRVIYEDRVRRYLRPGARNELSAAPSIAARMSGLGTGRGALQQLRSEVGAVALVEAFGDVDALYHAALDAGHGDRQSRHFAKQIREALLTGPPLHAGAVPVGALLTEVHDAFAAPPRALAPWQMASQAQK